MKVASAIVTERGGRTCHAAIVARELGVPAVVGADLATKALESGCQVTVSCADGEVGRVYEGRLAFEVNRVAAPETRQMRTMLNLGNPELAFHTAMLPNQGVGLARMEHRHRLAKPRLVGRLVRASRPAFGDCGRQSLNTSMSISAAQTARSRRREFPVIPQHSPATIASATTWSGSV
jgi:hypothetical protein